MNEWTSSDYGNITKGRKGRLKGGKWNGRKETMLTTLEHNGPLTINELYRKMRPAPHPSLRRVTSELRYAGLIEKNDDGKWKAI